MQNQPSQGDWDIWRESAVGQWFFDQYLPSREDNMKKQWLSESWNTSPLQISALNLAVRQSSANTLQMTREATFEGIMQDLGYEPETVNGETIWRSVS